VPEENQRYLEQIDLILSQEWDFNTNARLVLVMNRPFLVSEDIMLSGFFSSDRMAEFAAELGITHVINMAHGDIAPSRAEKLAQLGLEYLGIKAQDATGYAIMKHWPEVRAFAEGFYLSKQPTDRLLIHCMVRVI
jgi:hypothetical protein